MGGHGMAWGVKKREPERKNVPAFHAITGIIVMMMGGRDTGAAAVL